MDKTFAIIEIGSNNTKTHIYKQNKVIFENSSTIEFKRNYIENNLIVSSDFEKLFKVIIKALEFTENVYIFGCSIFRKLNKRELDEFNSVLFHKFKLNIKVVSQEEEALFTALGCYSKIDYNKPICIFVGGGGSIELIFVENKKIICKKFFDFGVVDITKKFKSLKDDIPDVTFEQVYSHVDKLIDDIDIKAEVLILAGGDHFYWYNNAGYKLLENTIYKSENQEFMITRDLSDKYDRDALVTSLDKIRKRSDNPQWFDGSRAMKVITNLISHKVDARYIIPTKINMEDGLRDLIEKDINSL